MTAKDVERKKKQKNIKIETEIEKIQRILAIKNTKGKIK